VWKATYLTDINIYLIQFDIQSLDPNIVTNFEGCVESTIFFDPAKAKEIAGDKGKPYPPFDRSK